MTLENIVFNVTTRSSLQKSRHKQRMTWRVLSQWSGMVDRGEHYDAIECVMYGDHADRVVLSVVVESPQSVTKTVEVDGYFDVEIGGDFVVESCRCYGGKIEDWVDDVEFAVQCLAGGRSWRHAVDPRVPNHVSWQGVLAV